MGFCIAWAVLLCFSTDLPCDLEVIYSQLVFKTGYNTTQCIRRYFQHAHFIPIVGVGKRGEY